MKAVTAYEMGVIEQRAMREMGLPSLLLMENAAISFVAELLRRVEGVPASKVMVFCGKGNNGGDGFAIARHLANAGAEVRVVVFGDRAQLKPDAQTNFDIVTGMGIPVYHFVQDRPRVDAHLLGADLVVDALFGTGFHGTLAGPEAEAVACINAAEALVAAVDMPSGADSDTGRVAGPCVQADLTITFGLPKVGQFLYPARALAGTVCVVPISLPAAYTEDAALPNNVLCDAYARQMLPPRSPDSHKGDYGKVFVLAGSPGLTGAPVLAADAVLKVGAGMVTVGVPASVHGIVAGKLTEAMTCPLPEMGSAHDMSLSKSAFGVVQEQLAKNNVLLMGCGLGMAESTVDMMHKLLVDNPLPMVVDADGINALAGNLALLGRRGADVVLTPHPAEFARMTGMDVSVVQDNRAEVARQFAKDFGVSLVLKGSDTVVAHPDGSLYLNTSGNSGMASAGSGDVLAGMIAGLVAQGLSVRDAANLGVYLHGCAGDCAAARFGEYSMTARNIVDSIHEAMEAVAQ